MWWPPLLSLCDDLLCCHHSTRLQLKFLLSVQGVHLRKTCNSEIFLKEEVGAHWPCGLKCLLTNHSKFHISLRHILMCERCQFSCWKFGFLFQIFDQWKNFDWSVRCKTNSCSILLLTLIFWKKKLFDVYYIVY